MAARISLAQVAAAAQVSVSTASLALSGDRRVAAGTRERVELAAARLGYFRDPTLSSLAAGRFRHTGKPALIATIGVPQEQMEGPARAMGMALHDLGRPSTADLPRLLAGLGAAALVALQRGFDPCLLGRLPLPVVLWEDEDPGVLAMDVVETADWWATLAATLTQVHRLGYRRPALVLHTALPRHWHDDVRLAAARFLGVPVCEYAPGDPPDLAAFIDRIRPDAVVGLIGRVGELLARAGRPLPTAAMITLDEPWCAEVAGMRPDWGHRARTTLECIEHRLRFGPRPPRRIIVPPRWLDGPSLPPVPAAGG